MCVLLCNCSCSDTRKPLQYRKLRLKSGSSKRKIIVEEEVVVVMKIVLDKLFSLQMALVLLLPSLLCLTFPFIPDFPLSVPDRTSVPIGDLNSCKIFIWVGGFKFPFGRDLLGWCPIVVFGSKLCIV
jgi:hypothetical protein